jgi:hypothetical protein|tara:strand:- start:1198 stop:1620 length:423 start_codon:yes stop_codon:yes gene_type:complete
MFVAAFVTSCASAFVLNYATYVCTRVNDALTTSVVGRTKSVVQGVGGLFAFSVEIGWINVSGLSLNSLGILWYAWEKYADERRRNNVRAGMTPLPKLAKLSGTALGLSKIRTHCFISQLVTVRTDYSDCLSIHRPMHANT